MSEEEGDTKSCQHRRGAHQATVTRTGRKVQAIIDSPQNTWDAVDIADHRTTIENSVVQYRAVHEYITQHFSKEEDEEADQDTLDGFEELADKWLGPLKASVGVLVL